MGKINVGRVIVGGLAAGVVINVIETLVNGLWLAKEWEAAMRALGKTMTNTPLLTGMYLAWGLAMGIFIVWVYAAIRPRFGPGPNTAFTAGVAAWVPGYVLSMVPPLVSGLFPERLAILAIGVGLVEVLLAAWLGAWIYREPVEIAGPGK